MASNTVHTMSIDYKAWCAKNSLPEPVELKDPLHLALWKVTCATFGVHGFKIVRVELNIAQTGANSAFLSQEKSMQVQLNQSMTATMIKRFTGLQRTNLSFHCPEPSPTISVVIEPEFVRKCTESKHVLTVVLGLDNGESVTTDIVMQIYSKHSGTRSKLLLNPKEKKPSSPRKGRSSKKSPKKNNNNNKTTRTVTVTDPTQKRRVLNSKRNAALVSDESDSEYEDVSSDEEFTVQPVKVVQTRTLRNRRGASSAKNNSKSSQKALRDEDEDEKSGESSSDESVSCVNQVDSPQAQENDEIAANQDGFPLSGLTREDREYFKLGGEAVLMDLDEIYYGLQEA